MLDEKLLTELQDYIERESSSLENALYESISFPDYNVSKELHPSDLEDYINSARQPTFSQVLFEFIDKKGVHDSDIYKRAGIDRRHFSKIRSNPKYRLGKNTAIALAMTLELNKQEFNKLLSAAGFSLSENDTFDLVIQFCLEKKIYDIDHVNQALDYFNLKPLAGI